MKFGLRGIRRLLNVLGNPQNHLKVIHIAGTNGKGSTAAFLASILTSAGYRTGLYTSPHLVEFSERIRINGNKISQGHIIKLVSKLQPEIEKFQCTFFEAVTAIAFQYFFEQKADIIVLETGLGGRLDATNLCKPIATIITSMSYEHTDILGSTLYEISKEKAGIIKSRVPCICGVENQEALRIIRIECKLKKAPLISLDKISYKIIEQSIDSTKIDVSNPDFTFKNLVLSLAGEFQVRNVLLAIKTITVLRKASKIFISGDDIYNGLNNVLANTGFRGRFTILKRKPLTILDVAHNPNAFNTLVKSLKRLKIPKVILMIALMKDKDYKAIIRKLSTITKLAIITTPKTERARSIQDLELEFRKHKIPVFRARNTNEGLRLLKSIGRYSFPRLITGSHFLAGETLATIEHKKYLTINQ